MMDFKTLCLGDSGLASVSADAILLIIQGLQVPSHLEPELLSLVQDAVKQGDLPLKAAKAFCFYRPTGLKAPRLIVAMATDTGAKAYRAALLAGLASCKAPSLKHLVVCAVGGEGHSAGYPELLARTLLEATYTYVHTKPTAEPAWSCQKVSVAVEKAEQKRAQAELQKGRSIGLGVQLARDCANRPANHATPTFLAQQASSLAKTYDFKLDVLDHKAVQKLGMGALMAVAQGSEEPLKFIVLQYQGAARSQAPVVLVGKGITFDTGGISLKPAPDMDEMKYDMSGAASVLGAFQALGELKPKLNVVGLIPACENMPSGKAIKPGDVVTSMSGQTIEILNTDAEGRLILCDALTYAERFEPAAVIDIATLTGACVIALGHVHSGLFSADDALAQQLLQAGQNALDTAWRMPLDEEYGEALKSTFADMPNVGPRAAGSVTAAMFLKRFTQKYSWAHLDIAGTAWKSGAAKGGTGRPVALLMHYLLGLVK